MKTFKGKENEKLSKFLLKAYDGKLSFAMLNKLFRKKDIKINGKRISKDCLLVGGEFIEVYYDGEIDAKKPQVIYEDKNVVVVIKPKGITSEDFFEKLKIFYDQLYFCHRLDRNTDGVMIFALNEQSYQSLFEGFKQRTFTKFYLAEVYGFFEAKEGILNHYLFKDSEKSLVKIYDSFVQGSKPVSCAYKVIEEKDESSLVKIQLFTGRTHQIRAQFAHVGHFVLGDGKYGVNSENKRLGASKLKLSSISISLNFEKHCALSYLNGVEFSIKTT